MRLAVVTAFLLLVGVLNTVRPTDGRPDICENFKEEDCGDGWTQAVEDYCVKYIMTAKSFQDAQVECHSHGADLVEIDRFEYLHPLFCFTVEKTPTSERQSIWISKERSMYKAEEAEEPYLGSDQAGDECVEMDAKVSGKLNDVPCSKKNYFVCGKKVDEEPDLA